MGTTVQAWLALPSIVKHQGAGNRTLSSGWRRVEVNTRHGCDQIRKHVPPCLVSGADQMSSASPAPREERRRRSRRCLIG
jgi:hypothetical protein